MGNADCGMRNEQAEPRAASREGSESRGDGDKGKGSERCEGREVRHLLDRGILDTWPGFRVA